MDRNHNLSFSESRTVTTTCTHSEHNPPTMPSLLAMARGEVPSPFTHRCPACGYGFTFAVGRPA